MWWQEVTATLSIREDGGSGRLVFFLPVLVKVESTAADLNPPGLVFLAVIQQNQPQTEQENWGSFKRNGFRTDKHRMLVG